MKHPAEIELSAKDFAEGLETATLLNDMKFLQALSKHEKRYAPCRWDASPIDARAFEIKARQFELASQIMESKELFRRVWSTLAAQGYEGEKKGAQE